MKLEQATTRREIDEIRARATQLEEVLGGRLEEFKQPRAIPTSGPTP